MPVLADDLYELPPGKIANVVTFLEMTARPAPRAVPPRPDLRLARGAHRSLDAYRDLFRRVGSEWLWFSRLVMPDEELAALLANPAVDSYTLICGGEPAGIVELDRCHFPDIELSFFGLVPSQVGTGAGRWLMEETLRIAWARGPRRLWVHTCTLDHPAALAFYVRSGFEPFRRAVEVADDPRLSGHLPRGTAAGLPLL